MRHTLPAGAACLAIVLLFTGRPTTGAALGSVTLVRGPYLQQMSETSAVVVWATREPGPASVEYWTGSETPSIALAETVFQDSSSTGIADYYQHGAALSGLRPATIYQYDLRVGGADATPGTVDHLRTAPVSGTGTIRLLAFGDSGTGSSAQSALATLMGVETADLVLHAGDIAYSSGTFAEFEARFFPYYAGWLRTTSFFPSIGNHDDQTLYATPYRKLFVLPRNGWSALFPEHAERYYSFDYGPVHFVALDTERAFQSAARRQEQLAWLDADLRAAQSQPWRIVFFHRPPYSAGSTHGSEYAVRQAFGPLLEKHGVQLVITGHEHDYERTVPWRESSDLTHQAVTYFVTGAGGAALYPAGQAAWTAFSRAAHHFLRASISETEATLEAVGVDGNVFDRFTLDRTLQERDTMAPTVSIGAPAPGAVLSGLETVEVVASDDVRIEKVDLWVDGQLLAIDLTAPYRFPLDTRTLADGSHTLEARAYDIDGNRAVAAQPVRVLNQTGSPEIVLYASEAPVRAGSWRVVADATAAGGQRIEQPNVVGTATISTPLADPDHYFEFTVTVEAGIDYRLWLRAKAAGDSGYNDSVWIQTSDTVDNAGAELYRIGATSATMVNLQDCYGCTIRGWGWQDNGFGPGVLGPLLRFGTGGAQTLRIQAREDGISIDQIVLSPNAYLNTAPGALKNDTTILAKDGVGDPPQSVLVTADAFVRAGANASNNFGSASELIVKVSATPDYTRVAYLKFDISSVQAGDNVRLRLLGRLSDAREPSVTTEIHAAASTWGETTITWDTKPAVNPEVRGTFIVSGTTPHWYEIDLTAFVQAERSAGQSLATIVLTGAADTLPYATFNSRELDGGPRLIISNSP